MNKKEIRKEISERKKEFSEDELKQMSQKLMDGLEENVIFKCAKTVMIYYSLPDEVYTHEFLEKWYRDKTILLPVVSGDNIILKVYNGKDFIAKGAYNIGEPQGEEFRCLTDIDMVIVPGVAFDNRGNRLGRGKGYYDRLLKQVRTFKVGVCFDFQLYEDIPTDELDVPMDEVWTEKGYVSKK